MSKAIHISNEGGYLEALEDRDDVTVCMVSVYWNSRRQGYGTELVNQLKKLLDGKTITGYVEGMGTTTNAQARKFWKSQGATFKRDGRRFYIRRYRE